MSKISTVPTTAEWVVPDNVHITEANLPGLIAAVVETLGKRIYVYEDGSNGRLLVTDKRKRTPNIACELLLIAWPKKTGGKK